MTAPAPTFVVQRLDHVVLRVRDLDIAEAFYREVLGCDVVRRRDDLGLRHLRAGASMIDLVAVDGQLGTRDGEAPGAGGRLKYERMACSGRLQCYQQLAGFS